MQGSVWSKYVLAGLYVGSHRNAGGQTRGEWKHSCAVIIPEWTPPDIRCLGNGERTSPSLLGNTSAKVFFLPCERWRAEGGGAETPEGHGKYLVLGCPTAGPNCLEGKTDRKCVFTGRCSCQIILFFDPDMS